MGCLVACGGSDSSHIWRHYGALQCSTAASHTSICCLVAYLGFQSYSQQLFNSHLPRCEHATPRTWLCGHALQQSSGLAAVCCSADDPQTQHGIYPVYPPIVMHNACAAHASAPHAPLPGLLLQVHDGSPDVWCQLRRLCRKQTKEGRLPPHSL